ncbi:MAG: Asp-tRNA(Asn)/Glu-tRNA(Gln) amidotransferase subunit GatA [Anaerolineaceae bacterium]|nr:Asp-tRNA(Asn)/Glu-tRNA(Gln) amidotransferase subunit GatA [Anaerolineaceae bacterium]MDE0327489.1 Asp-tRNA(Asn)/Glu-tRNA(Gln) amidotransferase subunit GatA [Anaerolineaceae bacterium]
MDDLADITFLGIGDTLKLLREGQLSAVELTQMYLERSEALDPQLRAWLRFTPELALAAAESADKAYRQGTAGPLAGIPLGIKDVFSTKGIETTCGSNILRGYRPPYSATVVERLEAAGAVFPGKLNMDEFAMGSTTENSGYFPTHNPWDLARSPGGSSGGSAAAVAAGMVAGALGSDTGGSIRQPGAFCGIPALKPSYGRCSRHGLIAFGSSLDCPGPMARSVEDLARLLQIIAGHDPRDATSLPAEVPDYLAALTGDVRGLKIGIPEAYFGEGLQPEVERAVRAAIAQLEELGAELRPVDLPHSEHSVATYYIIAPAEASANLARYDGVRYGRRVERDGMWPTWRATRGEGFGAEVKRRIMIGTYVLSAGYYDAWYGKAQAVRTLIKRDFDEAFREVDLIAAPTTPTTAFRLGENSDDPLQMYLQDIFTLPPSLAGIVGLNLPCGFDDEGLPIGFQLIAPSLGEALALRAGHAYEQAGDWQRRPPLRA